VRRLPPRVRSHGACLLKPLLQRWSTVRIASRLRGRRPLRRAPHSPRSSPPALPPLLLPPQLRHADAAQHHRRRRPRGAL
jgi:hypothetical protein